MMYKLQFSFQTALEKKYKVMIRLTVISCGQVIIDNQFGTK